MSETFFLTPYPGSPAPQGVRVSAGAGRRGACLTLSWRLEGAVESLDLALPARPERRFALWEQTCFEFFLACSDRPGYWEFNLSPAGHWNVFRFDGYRAGMRDEPAFDVLPFEVSRGPGWCEAALGIDLTALGCADAPWRLAVSMVMAEHGGRQSFWAAAHPGAQPDFHHPASFVVQL